MIHSPQKNLVRDLLIAFILGLYGMGTLFAQTNEIPTEFSEVVSEETALADSPASLSPQFAKLINQAIADRRKGQVFFALNSYLKANEIAQTSVEKSYVAGEVGLVLMRSKHYQESENWLTKAYNLSQNPLDRARYAMELGNLNALQNRQDVATTFYQESLRSTEAEIRAATAMNLIRMNKGQNLEEMLPVIERDISAVEDLKLSADLSLRLASLAQNEEQSDMRRTVFTNAQRALSLARTHQFSRIQVGALETLSELYEKEERFDDSLVLTRLAIQAADPNFDQDLLILLEWRRARLTKTTNIDEAIEAYRNAVGKIEEIRMDIPIVYEDGKSSFRETLEPIYLGLSDLLLQKARVEKDFGNDIHSYLSEARNTAEAIKQSELQDYLGDRCTVASVEKNTWTLAKDTAVLYPIIFKDRLETLIETTDGIDQFKTVTPGHRLRNLAYRFSNELRNGELDVNITAHALYQLLLEPIELFLQNQNIKKVIVVPDGVLRLVPYAALFDGKNYAIERYAFSTSSALSLTYTTFDRPKDMKVLIAGLEKPGPVVEVLGSSSTDDGSFSVIKMGNRPSCQSIDPSKEALPKNIDLNRTRDILSGVKTQELACQSPNHLSNSTIKSRSFDENQLENLRISLALPGVVREVSEIQKTTNSDVLMNEAFTFDRFRSAVQSGKYNVIHIASHGVFGGNSDNSYLLSHDQVITINSLQQFLHSDNLVGKSIELLSLSACETADGDDRAPLGISGAALKARAKSALGTLWPVVDEAAQQVMIKFYRGLNSNQTKTEALREAQLYLLKQEPFHNPFFWAPFILVGSWL